MNDNKNGGAPQFIPSYTRGRTPRHFGQTGDAWTENTADSTSGVHAQGSAADSTSGVHAQEYAADSTSGAHAQKYEQNTGAVYRYQQSAPMPAESGVGQNFAPQYVNPPYTAPYFVPGMMAPRRNQKILAAKKDINSLVGMLFIYMAANIAVDLVMFFLTSGAGIDYSSDLFANWSTLILEPLTFILPFVIYTRVKKKEPTKLWRFEKTGFMTAALCVLAGLALTVLGNYPAWLLTELLENANYVVPTTVPEEFNISILALEMFATAILVPVSEEFVFRGIILSSLQKHGNVFAVFVSAFIFALCHVYLPNMAFAFVFGVVAGFIYVRTRNLWITIFIHILNNAFAVLDSYSGFIFGSSAEAIMEVCTWVVFALGALAFLLILIFRRGIFTSKIPNDVCEKPIKPHEGFAALLRSVAMWIFVIVFIVTMNLVAVQW